MADDDSSEALRPPGDAASSNHFADANALHVWPSPFKPVAHIVSANTLAKANAANDAPVLEDFGDLRRHNIEELPDRLDSLSAGDINEYITAIEKSAGRQPVSADLVERFTAVRDVLFEGCPGSDGKEDFPADSQEFRSDWEETEAPAEEFRGYDIVSKAMSSHIPRDLFERFAGSNYGNSPVFSSHIDDHVSNENLDALIAALEARGYTVIR